MNYKLVSILVLLSVVIVFIVQNTAVVEFRLLFWTLSMSRSLMLFVLLGLGIAIGWFLRGYLAQQKPN